MGEAQRSSNKKKRGPYKWRSHCLDCGWHQTTEGHTVPVAPLSPVCYGDCPYCDGRTLTQNVPHLVPDGKVTNE